MASNTFGGSSVESVVSKELVFVEEPERKYVCPVCLVVMKDAVQTICGHRFCKLCIEKVSSRSGRCKCPVDNTWFHTKDEMFADIAVRREIQSLKVRCYQHDSGCAWTGDLLDLQGHAGGCEHIEIRCEFGCGEHVRRADVPHHREVCDLRPVSCEHCSLSTTSVAITRHQLLDCRKFPVVCSLCGKSGISREDISCHLNEKTGDCPRVIIPCLYKKYGCQFAGRREAMSQHEEEASHLHIGYLEKKIDNQDQQIESLTELLQQVTRNVEENKTQFTEVVETLKRNQSMSFNGSTVWKVTLVADQNRYISPPFYTGNPGYKLRVSLELKGHTESSQSYASLFVIHEQGQFDDAVFFPFNAYCHVDLLSNTAGKTHSVVVNCPAMHRCRTEAEMSNIQRGLLRFLPSAELLGNVYCQNNCIYMGIRVSIYQN